MVGYYKRPDLDAQSFTPDGFFRTGDKGELHANGLLKLSGRVKEIFKTSKGKYVAPAPIENRINAHPMVETSMVSGVGQSAAYAMVVLAESLRPQLNEAAVRDRVQAELAELLQQVNQSVAEYERLQMIVVTQQPWSIENGMLTPTMKIRRSQIEASVEAQLPNWYASQARVQWH
jgi:long-subunit acyl-CoA synthetase (AMP-forming)